MANDEEVEGKSAVLDESNDWKVSFTDLDKYLDGEEIEYSVIEVEVPEYYEASPQDPVKNEEEKTITLTLINILNPPATPEESEPPSTAPTPPPSKRVVPDTGTK